MRPLPLVLLLASACTTQQPATATAALQQNTPLTRAIRCDDTSSHQVKISFGEQGCFGGPDDELVLDRTQDAALLSGFVDVLTKTGIMRARFKTAASADEAEQLFRLLDPFIEAPTDATPGSCNSTSHSFIHVDAICGAAHESRTVQWMTCESEPAIHETWMQLATFVRNRSATLTDITPDEIAEMRANWENEGVRSRVLPITRWEDGGR